MTRPRKMVAAGWVVGGHVVTPNCWAHILWVGEPVSGRFVCSHPEHWWQTAPLRSDR